MHVQGGGYLTTTAKDFVLSRSDPPSVDSDTAARLVSALAVARPNSAAEGKSGKSTRVCWRSAGKAKLPVLAAQWERIEG